MRRIGSWVYILILVGIVSSCEKAFTDLGKLPATDKVYDEALGILEEQYVFTHKIKSDGWENVKKVNKKNRPFKNEFELFLGIDKLVSFLQDGHTNLVSPYDLGRSWSWFENYPTYIDEEILRDTYFLGEGKKYLNGRYWISGGLKHFVIKRAEEKNFGYIQYSSFSGSVGNMPLVFSLFKQYDVKGVILDLRNNGGGFISNAEKLLSFLIQEKKVAYQKQLQISSGKHGEITKEEIAPSGSATKLPVIVLMNRSGYSATNLFVAMTKAHSNIKILGDSSGGGSGVPKNFLLSNGWMLRVSVYQLLDAEGKVIEDGVSPDYPRTSKTEYEAYKNQKKDYFIEEAIKLLD